MENPNKSQENWGGFIINHFQTDQGSMDEYVNKKTGKIAKIVMRGVGGKLATLKCDPDTGKLNELIEYNSEGEIIKLQDQKAIREALQDDNVWHARMLEEIKIQHGNTNMAEAMIDQMFDEEMIAQEQKQ